MKLYLSISERMIVEFIMNMENVSVKLLIQYADFNVLNYFYENNFKNDVLNKLYLYPDSTATYLYIKYILKRDFKKIVCTDLQNNLLSELDKNRLSVFLFGDSDSILESAIVRIKKKYSNININGSFNGYNFNTSDVISRINKNRIDVLFVGLGVGRQEKWIMENYTKLNVKIIMSVGGWFQYLAGNKKRAPLFLRKIHLEWLYKLIKEFPRVWDRYLIGVAKFYTRVLTKKIEIYWDEK